MPVLPFTDRFIRILPNKVDCSNLHIVSNTAKQPILINAVERLVVIHGRTHTSSSRLPYPLEDQTEFWFLFFMILKGIFILSLLIILPVHGSRYINDNDGGCSVRKDLPTGGLRWRAASAPNGRCYRFPSARSPSCGIILPRRISPFPNIMTKRIARQYHSTHY